MPSPFHVWQPIRLAAEYYLVVSSAITEGSRLVQGAQGSPHGTDHHSMHLLHEAAASLCLMAGPALMMQSLCYWQGHSSEKPQTLGVGEWGNLQDCAPKSYAELLCKSSMLSLMMQQQTAFAPSIWEFLVLMRSGIVQLLHSPNCVLWTTSKTVQRPGRGPLHTSL